jgi:hypothetical protein
MSAGWKTLDIQTTSQKSTYRKKKKTWMTIKETTRRIQSWDRNRSFIGLNLWQEQDGGTNGNEQIVVKDKGKVVRVLN